MTPALDGVLVVDKPAGMTSHDVIDVLRRRFDTRRVGHAGTLDPDATGVLVVGFGRATRLLDYAQAHPKRYEAVARFGITTTTQDASGEVVARRPVTLGREEIVARLQDFVGEIKQVPPMVSAVKLGGERLYKKARRGEDVDRPARAVMVWRIEVVDFVPGPNPAATLDVICAAGTYIRTLVHDLGQSLDCGAHLEKLRRLEAGGFKVSDAVAVDEARPEHVRPPLDAVSFMPVVEVDPAGAGLVSNGRPLPAGSDVPRRDGAHVAVVHNGDLLGVYVRRAGGLVADRVMPR